MKIMKFHVLCILLFSSAVQSRADNAAVMPESAAHRIHGDIMGRFYDSGTRQIRTRLNGGDALEDCTLYGGFYLACLCDAYSVSQDSRIAADAQSIFEGLQGNLDIAGIPGFLARGRAGDGSYRGDPSVDQYTALFYSFWRYYHSPISNIIEREYIKSAFQDILERFERAGWRITKEDGELTTWHRLNAEMVTRADRLLAFLLAGYDITGDRHWFDVYNSRLPVLLGFCSGFDGLESWVLIQSQVCLRMLIDLERRPDIRDVFVRGSLECAELCLPQLEWAANMPGPDSPDRMLNDFYGTPPVFTWSVRNPIEATTVMLLTESPKYRAAACQALDTFEKRYRLDKISMNVAVVPWEWSLWLAANRNK